ncbi:MAG TPA: hypothetical protein VE081_04235 [Sporichthyaceae bacterium]|nr:hypothetical protein [Sporichthyaceae bacterium]
MDPSRSGRLVAWGNAVLAGLVSPDTAADRVAGADCHRVGSPDRADTTLPVLLAGLRSAGVRGLLLVLPVPGDLSGLPGPSGFNNRALDAGQAVLTLGGNPQGLVPGVDPVDPDGPPGTVVRWHVEPVAARVGYHLLSLAEAERELSETLREVTVALAELDLARWRPQLAEALGEIRSGNGAPGLAPGYPGRAHRVLASAQRLAAIADLVRSDPAGAAGAGSTATRDALLRPLATAARRATVAAFNSVAEPLLAASP